MPKEPGEQKNEDKPWEEGLPEKNRQNAEIFLTNFQQHLEEIEKDEIVDLDKTSSTIKMGNFSAKITMGDGLRANLEGFKKYINQLDPEKRKIADDLIVRAEIYLAAHEPKKEK